MRIRISPDMSPWLKIGVCVLSLALVLFFGMLFVRDDTEALARAIVKDCARSSYAPTCYEEKIPALMDQGASMESATEVMRTVLRLDPSYTYCHVIGHKIAAKETAKDPSRWQTVAAHSPTDICSYGFIHGAFQERFKAEALPHAGVEELVELFGGSCTDDLWQERTEGEQTNCMHALGHLLMYVTLADAQKSVGACERLGLTKTGVDMRRSCYEGLFMQLYQPLEPEDFALIEGKAPTNVDERDAFCRAFAGMPRASCLKEGWPLDETAVTDPKKVPAFCAQVAGGDVNEEDYCFSAVAYIAAARMQFKPEPFIEFCNALPRLWSGTCLSYGAPRFFEIHGTNFQPSLAICAEAVRAGKGDRCFSLLTAYAARTFKVGSAEALQLCAALPLSWKEECERAQATGIFPPLKP